MKKQRKPQLGILPNPEAANPVVYVPTKWLKDFSQIEMEQLLKYLQGGTTLGTSRNNPEGQNPRSS